MKAFDEHLNMVLGEVEEVQTSLEVDPATGQASLKVGKGMGRAQCLGASPNALIVRSLPTSSKFSLVLVPLYAVTQA